MDYLQATIIAIVEGITEFLPISSTGHMIITEKLLGLEPSSLLKVFTITIQFGAILSVVCLYWKKFFKSIEFYVKLFVAFLPAAIFGYLLNDYIDKMLESVWVVAISMIAGGIVLIFIDSWLKNDAPDNQEVTYPKAFKIGLFQVISVAIPGISRSAATIIGGMTQKLNRTQAAEFSFFLAVPTMFAASVWELRKYFADINSSNISLLIVGNIIAFIVALLAIKSFIGFLTKHGFKLFGYYRIIVGGIILAMLLAGIDLNIAG
jgi:undecaprenyl-diphosphatase